MVKYKEGITNFHKKKKKQNSKGDDIFCFKYYKSNLINIRDNL